jgi:hypothetical protein
MFSDRYRVECRKANVPESAHGLRKAGATRAVDNGATEAQLEAMFGWSRGSSEARSIRRRRIVLASPSKVQKSCFQNAT